MFVSDSVELASSAVENSTWIRRDALASRRRDVFWLVWYFCGCLVCGFARSMLRCSWIHRCVWLLEWGRMDRNSRNMGRIWFMFRQWMMNDPRPKRWSILRLFPNKINNLFVVFHFLVYYYLFWTINTISILSSLNEKKTTRMQRLKSRCVCGSKMSYKEVLWI